MKISLSKISQVLPEFVDTRLMPSAPSTMKWILGGSTFLILHQADTLIGKYLPVLKQVGIVDENNKVDIEAARDSLTVHSLRVVLWNTLVLNSISLMVKH